MSERKSINKYYPYDSKYPSKSKSKNNIIRFELPFPIYCLKCDKKMDIGKRFNAKKLLERKYLNEIPIFSFEFKCTFCKNLIKIETDPALSDYNVVSGGRRTLNSLAKAQKIEQTITSNPMELLLEKKLNHNDIKQLHNESEMRYSNDYTNSVNIRDKLRKVRRSKMHSLIRAKSLGFGFDLKLSPLDDMVKSTIPSVYKRSNNSNIRNTLRLKKRIEKIKRDYNKV